MNSLLCLYTELNSFENLFQQKLPISLKVWNTVFITNGNSIFEFFGTKYNVYHPCGLTKLLKTNIPIVE